MIYENTLAMLSFQALHFIASLNPPPEMLALVEAEIAQRRRVGRARIKNRAASPPAPTLAAAPAPTFGRGGASKDNSYG
jgi:hypothetical protein